LTSSLYFKAYKNGYKELAFIILFLLSIPYIPSLGVVFILTPVRRPYSRYMFPSTILTLKATPLALPLINYIKLYITTLKGQNINIISLLSEI
jgi:hypothetical protein